MNLETVRLDKFLLENSLITEENLQKAKEHRKESEKLLDTIIDMGFATEQDIIQCFSQQLNLPIINLDEIYLPEMLIKRIPKEVIEKHEVIPISYREGVLTVATHDPFDFDALNEVQLVVNCRVNINLSPRSSIRKAIKDIFYVAEEETKELEKSPTELLSEIEKEKQEIEKQKVVKVSPLQTLSPRALSKALARILIEKGITTEEEIIKKSEEG
jgi:type IV pilus assembly protein PilB